MGYAYLLIAVRDIPNLVPRKRDFGVQLVFWIIDVKAQGIDTQQQFSPLLILNYEEGKKENKNVISVLA